MTKNDKTKYSRSASGWKETELGQVPEDWNFLRLGDVCEFKYGKGLPQRSRKYGSYNVYGSNGIVGKHNDFEAKGPGIIVGRKGSAGEVIYSESDFWPIDTTYYIEKDSHYNIKFLFYKLKTLELKHLENSSAIPGLNRNHAYDVRVALPFIDEQQKIADVLGTLDEKIELLRKMNKNLEEIGQEIFSEYLLSHTNSLTKGKIGDVVKIYDSKRVPLSSRAREKRQGIYPYYGATSIMDYIDDYLFDGTYLLLGEDGSVAKVNGKPYTQYVWGKIWVNNHAHVLQGTSGFSTELLKLFFDSIDIQPYVTGAVQAKLNQENLKHIPINIPTKEILKKLNSSIIPLFEMVKNNTQEISILSQIRDSLLPRLMSGKLRVK